REHLVRLADLLEPLFRRLVPGVDIRVVLPRQLPVSLLDLLIRSRLRHTQDLIVVLDSRHPISPPSRHEASGVGSIGRIPSDRSERPTPNAAHCALYSASITSLSAFSAPGPVCWPSAPGAPAYCCELCWYIC